jgi:hypothetical protein
MVHGREKSDSAIVAGETDEQSGPNRSGAGGAKGGARRDANQQSTDWAQNRATMSRGLGHAILDSWDA